MTPAAPVLLMTRPGAASHAFAQELRDAGAGGFALIVSPLIGIDITGPLPDPSQYRGVIFTSAHAVAAFTTLGGQTMIPCFTVGATTAAAAVAAGFSPTSADGDAETLIALIRAAQPPGPLLHLRGTHSRGQVAQRLVSAGIKTHEAVIYDQPLLDLTAQARAALTNPAPVIVPLFSPRSAARFAQLAPRGGTLWVVAMSPAVAQALSDLRPASLCTAARPTGIEMRKMVAMLIEEARKLEGGKGAQ